MVGPIEEKINSGQIECLAHPPPNEFISPDEIGKLVKPLHYSVFPYRGEIYQLVASAAFLDAFVFLKPVIALKNPYFDYYFDKIGDIGYLCNNQEDMLKTIISLAEDFPMERYKVQRENLLKGRSFFQPKELASKLKMIMGDV